MHWQPTLL